jgi:hypothetical protein
MARGATRITTTIDLSGPFFAKDVKKTFLENVHTMLEAIAEEGESDVRAQLVAGQSSRAEIRRLKGERVSSHAVGRVKSLAGKNWRYTAVISVNNSGFTREEGISLMAAASYLEGKTRAFRKTSTRLRRAKAINQAELTKGLS